MIKYAISFSFLLFLFLYRPLNAQEYLLDSLSSQKISQFSIGRNETNRKSKFKYDNEKRLVSRVNRATYEIYIYSDEKNTKENYLSSTNELRFSEIDFLNEEGLIDVSVRNVINREGEHIIQKIDSLNRDENNLLTNLMQYERYYGDIKIAKTTDYYRNADGKILYKLIDRYKELQTVYDYIVYRDSIHYTYDGVELKEINKIRYKSTGDIDECVRTKYAYFEDHFIQLIETSKDDACEIYTPWLEIHRYYSDSDYYTFDSVFFYGFKEEGWVLFSERRTEDYVDGDDIIVTYEESQLVFPFSEHSGISFYKESTFLLNSRPMESGWDFELKPNISRTNGLITIETNIETKANICLYNIQGALIYSEKIINDIGIQLVAPNEKGTYFVKIIDEDKQDFVVKKLIVF